MPMISTILRQSLRVVIISILLVMSVVPTHAAEEIPSELTLAIPYGTQHERLQKLKHFYDALFARMGIEVHFSSLQGRRAASEADLGLIDGEAIRTAAYAASIPHMIRVQEPVIAFRFTLYTCCPAFEKISALNDLPQRTAGKWEIGAVKGIKGSEHILKTAQLPAHTLVVPVSSTHKGLQMLASRRLHFFIGFEGIIDALLEHTDFQSSPITKVALIKKTPAYLYLHKRHAALVPKIEQTLRQMKTDGAYNELVETTHRAQ